MWLIRCDVRIRTAQSGAPGVCRRSGQHLREHQYGHHESALRGKTGDVAKGTGWVEAVRPIHGTGQHDTTGMRPPCTDLWVIEGDYGPQVRTFPPSPVRSYRDGEPDTDSEDRMGRSQIEAYGTRNRRGSPTGASRHDQRCTRIWRGNLRFEDAVGQCIDVTSQTGTGCPRNHRRQRSEICQLPGHFRVRLYSVERLNCSTPDGHTKQARQISRWTVEDVVCTYAKNISVRAECVRQSGRAPSEPWETPRWRITPRLASIPRVALYIALRSPFRYPLASGLQCNGWRCENLSSCSFYIKLEERRKKVRRYDTTRP